MSVVWHAPLHRKVMRLIALELNQQFTLPLTDFDHVWIWALVASTLTCIYHIAEMKMRRCMHESKLFYLKFGVLKSLKWFYMEVTTQWYKKHIKLHAFFIYIKAALYWLNLHHRVKGWRSEFPEGYTYSGQEMTSYWTASYLMDNIILSHH